MARKGGKALAKTVKRLQGLFATFKNNFKTYQGESGEAADFKKKRDGSWFASERNDSFTSAAGKWFTQNVSMPATGFNQGFNNPDQPRSDRAFQYGQMVGAVLNHWSVSMQKGPPHPTIMEPQSPFNSVMGPSRFVTDGASGKPLSFTPYDIGARYQGGVGTGGSPSAVSYETWKRRLSGPEGGEKRQFSQLARNVGGAFLRNYGSYLPPDLRAHAEIAANGTSNESITEKQLMENFRVHGNYDHSGATASRQAAHMIRGALHHAFKYATLGAQIQDGGARGAMATGQVLMHGLMDAEALVNNTATKAAAASLVKSLIDSGILGQALTSGLIAKPLILEQAIAGAGRVLAGAAGALAVGIGTVVVGGATIAQTAWSEYEAEAGSDKRRKQFGNPALSRHMKAVNEKLAMRNVSTPVFLLNMMGLWDLETYKAGVLDKTMALQSHVRTHSSEVGVRGIDAISKYAAKIGKSVMNLSAQERIEALDYATETKVNNIKIADVDWLATRNSIVSSIWDVPTYGWLRGRPNFVEAYRQNRQELLNDLLTGQGIYANDKRSPEVRRMDAERRYYAFVASKPNKFWSEVRLTGEKREREAVGMRTRRQVQNFD